MYANYVTDTFLVALVRVCVLIVYIFMHLQRTDDGDQGDVDDGDDDDDDIDEDDDEGFESDVGRDAQARLASDSFLSVRCESDFFNVDSFSSNTPDENDEEEEDEEEQEEEDGQGGQDGAGEEEQGGQRRASLGGRPRSRDLRRGASNGGGGSSSKRYVCSRTSVKDTNIKDTPPGKFQLFFHGRGAQQNVSHVGMSNSSTFHEPL